MARRCFYSFHYAEDVTRAAKIRNIGAIEGNRVAPDNDWEAITRGGDAAIERWIKGQLRGRSCAIVLVGAKTAGRKWITHEIVESWNAGMGVVGIRIHGISNLRGVMAQPGGNPFDHVNHNATGKQLSSIVKCYDPPGGNSQRRYAWIASNINAVLEEALRIRSAN